MTRLGSRKASQDALTKEDEDLKKNEGKKGKVYWKIMAVVAVLSIALNVLACFHGFCDWYKLTIYGLISDALGMITGWIPVAIGELMAYVGVLGLLMGVILLVLFPFLRKRAGFRKGIAVYGKSLFMTLLMVFFIYTLNWIIPFRATILQVKDATERKYSVLELQNVRNHVVNQINDCAKQVPRDENGSVIYDKKAIVKAVYASMKAQAKDYPILSGYYPPMKDALYSDFLDWMNIGGYTYPYTMEVTWNKYCNDLYYPFLLAHESSHHQGYYQENEANFIAFLACTQSEDPLVRYAGYYEIYYYIEGEYKAALYNELGRDKMKEILKQQPNLSAQVIQDRNEALKVSRERYEADSHPAESLKETSAKVADVGWSTQGDLLQENGYDGVIKMVLQYYDVKEGGLESPF